MENNETFTETNIKRSQTCEKIMEEYLSLDKNEVVPLRLTMHFLKCRECRTEVHYLSLAERTAARHLKEKTEIEKAKNPISMTKWIAGGIAMMIFLLFFGVLSKNGSQEMQIAFYIFFAAAICAYCAVFIATNLDYFVKRISQYQSNSGFTRALFL